MLTCFHLNTEKTVNSVPYSCCSAEAENPCFFYNIDGKFGYWNVANPVSALHNASCMDKVKPKLYELGLKIESLYFYRLLLEVIMFLVSCVVQSSFESYHEHHHRPSVASLPLCWTLLASIVLTVFYNFSLHFFLWKYSFQVFFGSIDQGKLAELVGSLQGILNVVDTANSTNLSSS